MYSITHFHSKNVYYCIYYSDSFKVTALDMLQKYLGSPPPPPPLNVLSFEGSQINEIFDRLLRRVFITTRFEWVRRWTILNLSDSEPNIFPGFFFFFWNKTMLFAIFTAAFNLVTRIGLP